MLGPFEVRTGDGVLAEVPGARLRALLIALALEPGRVVSKAALIDWIWGEHPPADASNALQRLASRLRKALQTDALEGQPGGYRLKISPDAVDALRFESLVTEARAAVDTAQKLSLLREALALWRGAAMQDVGLEDSEAYDAAVTRLEGLRLTALEDRYEAEVSAELIPELTDLVATYPIRERLAAALMRALATAGRDSEALLVYERTREALADALGVDPSTELSALHVALLRGEIAQNHKSNIRAELTSFVGRDADLNTLKNLVAEHRLTTVIGPGGSGKTRLATEAARTMLADWRDGVWLVELAPSSADEDVVQAALTGLGLRDALLGTATSNDPLDGLITAIRDREALLILDNCEHVIEAAAKFADRVLGECRRVRILATSREPLGITGEALWQLEPLAVPSETRRIAVPGYPLGIAVPGDTRRIEVPGDARAITVPNDAQKIADSPAVRLLRDRASAVRKDLGLDEHTLTTMARICRALDGMPLAIELAAARLRTMTLEQLANRLDDRFRLLTSGSRTALPRHKTLRAVVDWSWELLTDAEKSVLRRLSVFSGGASLEAAERVCSGDDVDQDQVLELLTSLAEKSLLVTSADGAPRYRMLTTIKEYAAGKLAEAGESELTRQAHLAYFIELTETAEPHLRRAEQLYWGALLEADHDNISAALRGAIAAGETEPAMRLAAAAGWYWFLGGRRTEGLELLIAAAELPGEVSDHVRAMTYGLVVLYVTSGHGDENLGAEWIHKAYQLAESGGSDNPLLEFAIALERLLQGPDQAVSAFAPLHNSSDPWVRAIARWQTAKMRIIFGRADRADDLRAELEQALAQFRAIGERFGIYVVLPELASFIAQRGDLAGACEYLEQAATVLGELGAVEDVIEVRTQQAVLYWLDGDRDASAAAIAAAERVAEGVTWPYALVSLALAKAELARFGGDAEEARRQLDLATTLLGDVAEQPNLRASFHNLRGYLTDDLEESRRHRAAAVEAAEQLTAASVTARIIVGVADLAVRRGDYDQATRLLAASIVVRGVPDHSHPDAVRIEREARHQLGEERFAELTREGSETDWSELVGTTLAVS